MTQPLTKARAAKQALPAFAPEAERVAAELLGQGFTAFKPQKMTTFAWWYEDAEQTRILAVVAPSEVLTVTDEVLAYGLAWQRDRELVLVLSQAQAPEILRRLPWIRSQVSVLIRGTDGSLTAVDRPSRQAVLEELAGLRARTVVGFELDAKRAPWIVRLAEHAGLVATQHHQLANYHAWHHRGLQVLKVSHARGGLRIQAGVQYKTPPPGHQLYNTVINGPIEDADLDRVVAAVTGSVAVGRALTNEQREHRLQAGMASHPPTELGLPHLKREYAGYRGPGRPGFIDFLGCDAAGNLHAVETKIGHDPKVVLQALDYGIWVEANEVAVRASRPEWPVPAARSSMRLDYVLGRSDNKPAIGSYIASQLDALADDVTWRVFVVDNLDADVISLTRVHEEQLWDKVPGLTAVPVSPRRS